MNILPIDPSDILKPIDKTSVEVVLTQPYTSPAHAKAAVKVEDMFTVSSSSGSGFTYELGNPPSNISYEVTISNNCIENSLQVQMTLPSYLAVNISNPFILKASGTTTLRFSFIET